MSATRLLIASSILAGTATLAACATESRLAARNEAFLGRTAPLPGYLSKEEYPDMVALLPPPPEPGSPAAGRDAALNRAALGLRDSPRWELATMDAQTRFPGAAATFACAIGAPVSEAETPTAFVLMRRSVVDVGMSVRVAKKHYQRPRPFQENGEPVCTPNALRYLEKDGSYPSGHSTAGWAWALIFAELVPERTDEILARGWAFGQSRAICNVHWQSDIDRGRIVGAAVVARLHADEEFLADVRVARAEIASARERGLPPNRDCAAEAEMLRPN